MNKILFLLLLSFGFIAGAQAQGGDPEAFKQRYIDQHKTKLIEKAKLSEAEAAKVIDIRIGYMGKMRGFRDMSAEERTKAQAEIAAAQTKEYKAIPLTDEQIKAVDTYFEEVRKEMMKNRSGGN